MIPQKAQQLVGVDSDGYIKCKIKKNNINNLDDDFNIAPFI